jgi:hypothetical protein
MEPPSPTGLDNTLKAVQIAFYVIGATVAVLTYRAAKRGLPQIESVVGSLAPSLCRTGFGADEH